MKYGWSLEPDVWQVLGKRTKFYRWQKVILEKDYSKQVPQSSGIYLICASVKTKQKPTNGGVMDYLYNAIYVGQSENLRNRFLKHARFENAATNRARSIFRRLDFWHSEIESDELDSIEQLLIDALGPTANKINVIQARIGDPVPAG